VTPTTDVTPGNPVQVSISGVPSDQGLYVRWCAAPAPGQTRPTAEQCDGQGIWAVENYPFGPRPTDGTVVDPTDGPIALPTTASIGGIDCRTTTCGISTRRDHRGGADPSMDTFTPVALVASDEGDGGDDGDGGGGAGSSGAAVLSTTQAAPGDDVTVSGEGFQAGETIDGTLFSDPVDLGRTTADDDGTGALTFTVPDVEAGTHTVQLEGAESGRIVTATLTITGTTDDAPTGGESGSRLPTTGSLAAALAPWALAALVFGVLLRTVPGLASLRPARGRRR
jgi:hypothetical protein